MRTGRPKILLTLTPAERNALRKMAREGSPAREALRAGIILDCAKGWDNQTVATAHEVNLMTVGKWRRRFGVARLRGLEDASRARKVKKLDLIGEGEGSSAVTNFESNLDVSVNEIYQSDGLKKRVTLRDIAVHLKLHLSTVSLGLKNDPRLLPETRKLIRESAQKMGYFPDPMVRALAAYRQAIRPQAMHGTLALLAQVGDDEVLLSQLLKVLCNQAAKFGYKIELIECYSVGRSKERLTRILRSRGIQGLIVLPPVFGRKRTRRLQIDWEYFSSVVLGHALYHPVLHQVGNDHLANAQLLTRKLISLGYRRIGLCIDEQYASLHAGGGWEGGYFGEMRRQKDIPKPFYRKMFDPDLQCVHEIQRWIEKERLEVVILDTDHNAAQIYRYFKQISVACLVCFSDHFSGINPQYERVWEAGVDFLVHLINTHQRGVPVFPQRLLLRGDWVPGQTLDRMNL